MARTITTTKLVALMKARRRSGSACPTTEWPPRLLYVAKGALLAPLVTRALEREAYERLQKARAEHRPEDCDIRSWPVSATRKRARLPQDWVNAHVCASGVYCHFPAHTVPVPSRVNRLDADVKTTGTLEACRRGHSRDTFEYTARSGRVGCRACDRENGAKSRAKKKNVRDDPQLPGGTPGSPSRRVWTY